LRQANCADSRIERIAPGTRRNEPAPRGAADETEILRAFVAAAPWPIWTKRAIGGLSYANAAYALATEATSVADAIDRDLELLDSGDRQDMEHALNEKAAFMARLPIVVRSERRIYDVHALKPRRRSAGIAIDASEATALRAALCEWRKRIAAPSINCRPASRFRRPAAAGILQRFLSPPVGSGPRLFSTAIPTIRGVLDRLRAARKVPEQPDFRAWKAKLHEAYRAVEPEKGHLVICPTAARSASSPRQIRKAASPICSTTSPKVWTWARRFDGLIRYSVKRSIISLKAVAVFGSNGRAHCSTRRSARCGSCR